jgi:hypothetical protein
MKHNKNCNTLNPCKYCRNLPKHEYVGPIDHADCKLCGYSIDMPCHDISRRSAEQSEGWMEEP